LSKAKETRLVANTNRLPVHVTDTRVRIADPALDFRARPEREIVGIGAALKWDQESGAPQIANVLPNSPALQAGLSAGLIIHKIDAIATKGMRLEDCVSLIRGPVGTKVRLELIDPEQNETNTVELTRQRLQI
jgi:C-terminal processing protease CtpA/Prc